MSNLLFPFFLIATDAPCCATYGQGADPILLDNLNCIGTESQLIDCTHNGVGIHNCGHTEDAGLTCAGMVCINYTLGDACISKH